MCGLAHMVQSCWFFRIKELQTQGKRPNDQDLLVEWKVFWTKTLKEMFTTECGIMFENISNR